jgi:antitoxin StbD
MKKINEKNLYHVPTEKYELLMKRLEDYELGEIVKERQSEKAFAIEVELNDL